MGVGDPVPVTRVRVRIEGVVQGVGFRPHVHRLATELALDGFVGNDERGVYLEVEGAGAAIDAFLRRVGDEAPPLATVERVDVQAAPRRGGHGFSIIASGEAGVRDVLVPPDAATCDDCLGELRDPADRRHRYAFINCTDCGPRYTIVRDVPYDRANTTMAGFALCGPCDREYHDPADRRFHAQPVCCPDCGPRLWLETDGAAPGQDGAAPGQEGAGPVQVGTAGPGQVGTAGPGQVGTAGSDPVAATAALLRAGAVVAVKGLGGYHLAVAADDERAAATLRARKHREDKPFAVMVADLAAARGLCHVDDEEAALLTGPARPIVLLRRRDGAPVVPSVAPGNRRLGVMLPYTPLHHRLAAELAAPFVLTSGNVSDEPICHTDDDARRRLAGIADAFLLHDRAIHVRVDDSVAHVVAGRPGLLRRSRGFVPAPVPLGEALPRHVLGVGAELKSTVCLAKGRHAFVSHHIGDLENHETFRSFLEAIEHLGRLFDVRPEVVAHDLHPEYLSTKHAVELGGVELVGVQHHHAHVAACLVDNGEAGPAIGLALDGLGWGTDGTVWGGEVLVADLTSFERAGHLDTVPMPGGARAIRQPWRMAAAHLDAAFEGAPPRKLDLVRRNAERFDDVLAVARAGINSPSTSSAGRLFDAVAALLGIRDEITYEGQAAIELEQRADATEPGTYDLAIPDGEPFRLPAAELVRAVVADLEAGASPPVIAGRFHHAVAGMLAVACARVRERTGLGVVALSGGVFQNVLLTERTVAALERDGFRVLTHRRLPPNDGAISLGQVAVAGARDLGRARGPSA